MELLSNKRYPKGNVHMIQGLNPVYTLTRFDPVQIKPVIRDPYL